MTTMKKYVDMKIIWYFPKSFLDGKVIPKNGHKGMP
jgi:hypothetical protein